MSTVGLDRVAKRFGTMSVVSEVSLDIAEGELVALLGPSGSGKTTLLRLIAGFETVDSGRVYLDGDDVTDRPALERRCGMVFQHYALFPHLSVGENVAYGLANERLSRSARTARVGEVLAMVDLAGYETRPVNALSGGQQQRVALARALAPRPRVLLLDEPLSNLDPALRERTRRELRELVRRTGITTVLVTHEQEEAFDLADRIALLHLGRLEQLGAPEDLYATPATPFVAGFVGRTSTLTGRVVGADREAIRVNAGGAEWRVRADRELSGEVVLLVRPEGARFADAGSFGGVVLRRRYCGAAAFFTVGLDHGGELEITAPPGAARQGDRVSLEPTGTGAFAWRAPGPDSRTSTP